MIFYRNLLGRKGKSIKKKRKKILVPKFIK